MKVEMIGSLLTAVSMPSSVIGGTGYKRAVCTNHYSTDSLNQQVRLPLP